MDLWLGGCHREGRWAQSTHWRTLSHRGEAGAGGPNSGEGRGCRERWGLWETGGPVFHLMLPCGGVDPSTQASHSSRGVGNLHLCVKSLTQVLATKSNKKCCGNNSTHKT